MNNKQKLPNDAHALNEATPGGQRFEDLSDHFSFSEIEESNKGIERWNRILARYNQHIDLIPV